MEPEVEEAYAALARRDRLHAIDEAIREIEEILERVVPKAEMVVDGYAVENLQQHN